MSTNTEYPLKVGSSIWTSHLSKWFMAALVFIVITILLGGFFLSVKKAGLGSSDAAGWMQAIGTVVAVGAAFWIAKDQSQAALKSITDAQKLADESKRNGVLSVVRAAKSHATNIGNAVSDESFIMIYEVYDKTIIAGVVGALSAAPLYELGSPAAVAALLSLRDQFVFLGNQVEVHLAGPWKHEHLGPTLEGLRAPEYATQLDQTLKSARQQLASNVKQRVEYIHKQCEIIELALSA